MCPRGIQIGRPTGGIPSLTAADVAAVVAMGKLTRTQTLLLYVKYLLELDSWDELRRAWHHEVVTHGQQESWRVGTWKTTHPHDDGLYAR